MDIITVSKIIFTQREKGYHSVENSIVDIFSSNIYSRLIVFSFDDTSTQYIY